MSLPGIFDSVLFPTILATVFLLSSPGDVRAATPRFGASRSASSELCSPDRLTMYRLVLQTFWSEQDFPKQYPDFRPSAQWTKTLGRSHNSSYSLWRLGSLATEGLKTFAEVGKSDALDAETQGGGGVYDAFSAPPILKGVGRAETDFFVDGNHSKLSLIARIVPSPDWFVGIDSYDLCVQGKWIDAVTLEADPMDAGTDNGFTFTAPNWASEPQEKIYRITSQFPDHPANSFYYQHLKKLPTIATFSFVKIKEYELSEVFANGMEKMMQTSPQRHEFEEESSNVVHQRLPSSKMSTYGVRSKTKSTTTTAPTTTIRAIFLGPVRPTFATYRSFRVEHEPGVKIGDSDVVKGSSSGKGAFVNSLRGSYGSADKGKINRKVVKGALADEGGQNRVRHSHQLSIRPTLAAADPHRRIRGGPRNCRVSPWSEWLACSKSCGIGETKRTRTILRHARRGGKPCLNLEETKWCGSARCSNAKKAYFNW